MPFSRPLFKLWREHAHGYEFATQLTVKTGDTGLVDRPTHPFSLTARAHDSQGDFRSFPTDSVFANGDPADRREKDRLSPKECRCRCRRRRIAGAAAGLRAAGGRREDGAEEDD